MADINAILASDSAEVVIKRTHRLRPKMFYWRGGAAYTIIMSEFVIKCGERKEQSIYHIPSNTRMSITNSGVSIFVGDNEVARLWLYDDIYFKRCEDGRVYKYSTDYCKKKGREVYISNGLSFVMRRDPNDEVIVALRYHDTTLINVKQWDDISFLVSPNYVIGATKEGLML